LVIIPYTGIFSLQLTSYDDTKKHSIGGIKYQLKFQQTLNPNLSWIQVAKKVFILFNLKGLKYIG